MLVLSNLPNSPDGFVDHLDSSIHYHLPDRLTLTQTAEGEPDFFLLRYQGQTDGDGLLQLRLQLVYPFLNSILNQQPVSFEEGRFRLRVRSRLNDETGQTGTWHPVMLSGEQTISSSVHLDSSETQLLQTLLQDGHNVVEVELELGYRGLVLGMPWLVTAQTQALRNHLMASLGDQPVRVDQITAAFLSLPAQAEILNWRSLEPDAIAPERDVMLTEIAWRSREQFFQKVSPTPEYQLLQPADRDSTIMSWDLIPPRQEIRKHSLSWSISELFQQITDPQKRKKLFPVVDQVEFFGTLPIHVVNFLPLDARYLREVRVGLRFLGGNGVPEYRDVVFNGKSNVEQFTVVYPALVPFQLEYCLSAVLAPPTGVGWIRTIKRDFVTATRPTIEIDRKAAGIDFFRVEVEQEVFHKASVIEISVDSTSLQLTGDQPSAWIALPNHNPDEAIKVRCVAQPFKDAIAPAYTLLEGTTTERTLKIAAYQLEVLDPDAITLTLDPNIVADFHYVAVSLTKVTATETSQRRQLTPGQPLTWKLIGRNSVFEPIRFRYQIHYVAYNKEGNTLPMTSTEWSISEGNTLIISPPMLSSTIQ